MTCIHPYCRGLLVLSAILLMGIGCGKGGQGCADIRGEVTLDGTTLEEGAILFAPIEGTKGNVIGGEIRQGRYQMSHKAGLMAGWYRVEIRAVQKTGTMTQAPLAAAGEVVPEYKSVIPPRFNSSSTLKVEVKPGDNTADFQVASR